MIKWIAIVNLLVTTFYSSVAFACGGGFGEALTITPQQTIIIRHHEGEETYVFSPDFCGAAAEFGLILPIPNSITLEPALLDKQVFNAFDELSAPKTEYRDVCRGRVGSAGMDAGATADGGTDNAVEVISSGQVGIFDWTLLRADDSAAFTDWLDANQYPYDEKAVKHFDYYVTKSWYFIAFKVTAAQEKPDVGARICGSFGPIRFGFTTDSPVIPTRIASVGEGERQYFTWRIHALTSKPMTVDQANYYQDLHYAGVITRSQLDSYSQISTIAVEGDQLTSLDVSFSGSEIDQDMILTESSGPAEFRKIITINRYIDCADDPIATGGVQSGQAGCSGDCNLETTETQAGAGETPSIESEESETGGTQLSDGGCLDCDNKSNERGDSGGCSVAHDPTTPSIPLLLVFAMTWFVRRCIRKRF